MYFRGALTSLRNSIRELMGTPVVSEMNLPSSGDKCG